jgi:hydroxypyruvate reductase
MADLKQMARRIFAETLAAIDIPATMQRKLAREGSRIRCGDAEIDLAAFERIVAIAIGKAGFGMASGLCDVLAPEYHASGILAIPVAPPRELPGFRTFLAGHPVPNAASFAAGRAALDLLAGSDERTLVFFLLSGGGSALCEAPLDRAISLEDIQQLNRVLVACGAPIDDINAVRKHLSAVKGGRLAAAAPRAMKITLGVTDVPFGRESALASGPTLPDPTTVEDANRVVEQYVLLEKLPQVLAAKFSRRHSSLPETPKADHPAFERAHFQLLLGMPDLFHRAHRAAEAAGFMAICDNATDDWPLERAADALLEMLTVLKRGSGGRPVCLIADGEVSSPVTGDGIGGRNSAFALYCAENIAGKNMAVFSAGTDGVDGNSPAAGAVADGTTFARARAAGLDPRDYFRRSDAYTFFKSLGDTVETGPTGNNLRDLRILLHA